MIRMRSGAAALSAGFLLCLSGCVDTGAANNPGSSQSQVVDPPSFVTPPISSSTTTFHNVLFSVDTSAGHNTIAPDAYSPGLTISPAVNDTMASALVEADALGALGRGAPVSALAAPAPGYATAALDMFVDYDGAGSQVGDVSVQATTNDAALTSVYAMIDSSGNVSVVALNKSSTTVFATIQVQSASTLTIARVYQLASGYAKPEPLPSVPVEGNSLTFALPGQSVTTLVLE